MVCPHTESEEGHLPGCFPEGCGGAMNPGFYKPHVHRMGRRSWFGDTLHERLSGCGARAISAARLHSRRCVALTMFSHSVENVPSAPCQMCRISESEGYLFIRFSGLWLPAPRQEAAAEVGGRVLGGGQTGTTGAVQSDRCGCGCGARAPGR